MKRSRSKDPFTMKGEWWDRALNGFGALVPVALGLTLLPGVAGTEPGLVIYFYSFLTLMLAFPVRSIYRSFTWLQVYQEGVLIKEPFRAGRFLSWWKIARIRSRAWGSSLVVADSSGRIKAPVYSSLSNSQYFLGWLFHYRPDIWESGEGFEFTKSAVTSLFFLAGAVLGFAFAVTAWRIGMGGAWFFAGMAMLCVGLVLVQPYAGSLSGDSMVIRYPFRKRVVVADEIAAVEVMPGMISYVQLRMKGGKLVPLQFFSFGAGMLHAFLWTWHGSKTHRELISWGKAWPSGGVPAHLLPLPLLNPPGDERNPRGDA